MCKKTKKVTCAPKKKQSNNFHPQPLIFFQAGVPVPQCVSLSEELQIGPSGLPLLLDPLTDKYGFNVEYTVDEVIVQMTAPDGTVEDAEVTIMPDGQLEVFLKPSQLGKYQVWVYFFEIVFNFLLFLFWAFLFKISF